MSAAKYYDIALADYVSKSMQIWISISNIFFSVKYVFFLSVYDLYTDNFILSLEKLYEDLGQNVWMQMIFENLYLW